MNYTFFFFATHNVIFFNNMPNKICIKYMIKKLLLFIYLFCMTYLALWFTEANLQLFY